MMRYIVVSAGTGLLFAVMDGLINANPLAQRLLAVYKPIARESVNAPAGVVIDLAYGFVMAGLFLLLASALPGGPTMKGISFGLIAWFFRVAMSVAGQWVAFKIPPAALAYMLVTGLVEMLILGIIYGRALSGTVYHD